MSWPRVKMTFGESIDHSGGLVAYAAHRTLGAACEFFGISMTIRTAYDCTGRTYGPRRLSFRWAWMCRVYPQG